jgi:glycosyltransferase involved in cell wall biosynthesis
LLPQSRVEIENLEATLGRTLPYTIVRNAAEPGIFDGASPEPFVKAHGIRDFVLTVGLVENRKNQLMLLHALRDLDIPVVVVGRNYDRNYLRLCRRAAGPRVRFLEHLTHAELASAMKAAALFALPSWMECASFAEVEAALAGCPLVVGDRTSEREYFGDHAYYCDPASVESIRSAVGSALRNRNADAVKREALRERFTRDCTWENAAAATLAGYRAAFQARGLDWRWDGAPAKASPALVLAGL